MRAFRAEAGRAKCAAAAVLAIAAAPVLGGCLFGGGERRSHGPSDATVIRSWSRALNARDYRRAASFFAPGAIVEQAPQVYVLPDRSAALAFNRALPCTGTVTSVRDEGATSLAAFTLRPRRPGTRSACDSTVRVRFTIVRGRFKRWRQLPEREAPSGRVA